MGRNDGLLSVLIASYDRNSDLWPITHHFFRKAWPDCPFPVFVGANGDSDRTLEIPGAWVGIYAGTDRSWSSSLADYLNSIGSKYVLLYVDDVFLRSRPDAGVIESIVGFLEMNEGLMCRLGPNPGPEIAMNETVGRIDIRGRVPYATSWTNGIWNREFLLRLAAFGFDPWEFETRAGKTDLVLANPDSFYATFRWIADASHYVEKSRFYPWMAKLLRQEPLAVDFARRPVLPISSYYAALLKSRIAAIQTLLPANLRNRVRRAIGLKEL